MTKLSRLSLVLNSDQYYAGLMEICHRFEGFTSDEYLNGLVASLEQSNKAIFDVMHVEKVRVTIKQESRQLMERIMAISRYIDSSMYVQDDAIKASALVLKQVYDSYSKPFAWMKVDERVGAVSTLLRNLNAPEMQEHGRRLPELESRIEGVQKALTTLKEALQQVDHAKGTAPKGQPLMSMKREAADRLVTLVDYLEAMAAKQPDDYAEHLAVVMQIITRLNATRRKSDYLHITVELEDDEVDEPTDESEVALGA